MAFTSKWRRDACCGLDQDDVPGPVQNMLVFELTGYNYRTIPQWFDYKQNRLIPLQFSVDSDNMTYRYTFYKPLRPVSAPQGDPNYMNVWYLSTSDDIFPVIYEFFSGKRFNVERLTRHNGYTVWQVTY